MHEDLEDPRSMPTEDNPEWTDERFARAKPVEEMLPPHILSQFANGREASEDNVVRLSPEVAAHFRAQGRDWRERIDAVLREAAGL